MNFIRKKTLLPVILIFIIHCSQVPGQTPEQKGLEAITLNSIKAQLGFIASDLMEGRETGSKGEYLAAEYIASMLQLYGIKPGGDIAGNERTYFQNFTLLKSEEDKEPVLEIRTLSGNSSKAFTLVRDVDFICRPLFRSLEFDAPVVFISGKASENTEIDESAVKGKLVITIAGLKISERISAQTEKLLRSRGALGIIEIFSRLPVRTNPDREYLSSPSKERFPGSPISPERYFLPENTGDEFIRLSISLKAATILFTGTGIDPEKDTPETFSISPLSDRKIYFKTSVKTNPVPVRNVIGIIEGNSKDKVIVLGAHYDHMGMHDGYIWNGADDNGSGTTGVLTLAKAIAATGKKPEKTILFAFWTAEEKGLLGSRYYVQNSGYTLKDLKLNVNFDMISRHVSDKEPNKVTMTYTTAYPFFKNMTQDNLQKYGIDLDLDYQPSTDPPGGSDHRSFVSAGIPIMRFKPGHREEYHTPFDDISTIDWDIMDKIIRISFLNVWQVANSEW